MKKMIGIVMMFAGLFFMFGAAGEDEYMLACGDSMSFAKLCLLGFGGIIILMFGYAIAKDN